MGSVGAGRDAPIFAEWIARPSEPLLGTRKSLPVESQHRSPWARGLYRGLLGRYHAHSRTPLTSGRTTRRRAAGSLVRSRCPALEIFRHGLGPESHIRAPRRYAQAT